MFRNQYDNDVTVWSPQGRLHQIEYAMEAVKQGSAVVGIRSKSSAVLVALKRSPHDLASYQKKIILIDDHMAIAIAGLTSDARVLSRYMRTEALKSKMVYDRPLPVSRIINQLGDKAQANTQGYGGRPYGVGFLVIGKDETGPHLYESSPSGNNFEYFAMSIGARSQSAKTYLEKYLDTYPTASDDELIKHALQALQATLPNDVTLSSKNVSIALVGQTEDVVILEDDQTVPYLDSLELPVTEQNTENNDNAMED
ncbi:hypothetical protein K502DRAFT_336929 [Neoconidiobolus thromboides FSU 785]|nr:hypothetical protein K502DRAFT_336929 [Neoconidiobolus thromboides FSU 785]